MTLAPFCCKQRMSKNGDIAQWYDGWQGWWHIEHRFFCLRANAPSSSQPIASSRHRHRISAILSPFRPKPRCCVILTTSPYDYPAAYNLRYKFVLAELVNNKIWCCNLCFFSFFLHLISVYAYMCFMNRLRRYITCIRPTCYSFFLNPRSENRLRYRLFCIFISPHLLSLHHCQWMNSCTMCMLETTVISKLNGIPWKQV